MKQWIAALLLMLIPGVQAAKPQKVTLMVDDVPVAQVLQALAEQEKLNLVVSPDVSGTVSLHLTDVPWKQALQTVVKSAGLITRQEGNICRWKIAILLCNTPTPESWRKLGRSY